MLCTKDIHIPLSKWKLLVNNSDLRFFKYSKHCLTTSCDFGGYVVKIDTWDNTNLRDDYKILKRIKQANIILPICYFEYEGDILKYLSNDDYDISSDNGDFEEISVLIRKHYTPLDADVPYIESKISRQIVFCLFKLLTVHKIRVNNVDISNIYYQNMLKTTNLKYDILSQEYIVQTRSVVKIDLENIEILDNVYDYHFDELYLQISKILNSAKYKINYEPYCNDENPAKVLRNFLTMM